MKVKLGGYYLMASQDIVVIAQVGLGEFTMISLTSRNRYSGIQVNGKFGELVDSELFVNTGVDKVLSEASLEIKATPKTPQPITLKLD